MTVVTIPNRPAGTDQRQIALLLADFDAITTVVNGQLDANNLSAAAAASASMNQTAQVTKGVTSIATSESRTNVAYGTLPTPDQVTGLVVPAGGVLEVMYEALWQQSVTTAGRAAIFIGANQLNVNEAGNGAVLEAAGLGGNTGLNQNLYSFNGGLVSINQNHGQLDNYTTMAAYVGNGTAYGVFFEGASERDVPASSGAGTITISDVLGGPCLIRGIPAGTYTVSVQFKSSSGSVTVSNRTLWCKVHSYT